MGWDDGGALGPLACAASRNDGSAGGREQQRSQSRHSRESGSPVVTSSLALAKEGCVVLMALQRRAINEVRPVLMLGIRPAGLDGDGIAIVQADDVGERTEVVAALMDDEVFERHSHLLCQR